MSAANLSNRYLRYQQQYATATQQQKHGLTEQQYVQFAMTAEVLDYLETAHVKMEQLEKTQKQSTAASLANQQKQEQANLQYLKRFEDFMKR